MSQEATTNQPEDQSPESRLSELLTDSAHVTRDPKLPNIDDTVRVGDGEELVAVVVRVGIGLSADGSGTEIVKAKVGDGEIRNFFAAACEVIGRADGDRVAAVGGDDGDTLKGAMASDVVVEHNLEDINLIDDDELDRLTAPDDTLDSI